MDGLLADLVLLVHLVFVLFVIFGGLLILRGPRWALVHLPALAWGVYIEVSGGVCPLTPLENRLRGRAAEGGTEFIERIVVPVLYPPGLQPEHQWVLATLLALFNLAVYLGALRRWSLRDPGGDGSTA